MIASCAHWTLDKVGVIINGHTYCMACKDQLDQVELRQAFRLKEAAYLLAHESHGCACERCHQLLDQARVEEVRARSGTIWTSPRA